MNHQIAYMQVASWLRQQPGVLWTRVAGHGDNEEIVIGHDDTLSNEARKRITDRLDGLRVRFEKVRGT